MMESTAVVINTQLVDSIVQVILALSSQEQSLLLDRLIGEIPYPSTAEMLHLADQGGSFDFWQDEPDLYTFNDGEPVVWS